MRVRGSLILKRRSPPSPSMLRCSASGYLTAPASTSWRRSARGLRLPVLRRGTEDYLYANSTASISNTQSDLDAHQIRDLAAGRRICPWRHAPAALSARRRQESISHPRSPRGDPAELSGALCCRIPLMAALAKTCADDRLEERLTFSAKPKLLIVSEPGCLPCDLNAASVLPSRLAALQALRPWYPASPN